MILNKQPVTMAEAAKIVKTLDEKKPIHSYLKKFCETSEADAKKLKADLVALNNPKFKEEHYIKIIDFLPKDIEDIFDEEIIKLTFFQEKFFKSVIIRQ